VPAIPAERVQSTAVEVAKVSAKIENRIAADKEIPRKSGGAD
jgi:hypothetical protein